MASSEDIGALSEVHDFVLCTNLACTVSGKGPHCEHQWCGRPPEHPCHALASRLPEPTASGDAKCGALHLHEGERYVCVKPPEHTDYHATTVEDVAVAKGGVFWWGDDAPHPQQPRESSLDANGKSALSQSPSEPVTICREINISDVLLYECGMADGERKWRAVADEYARCVGNVLADKASDGLLHDFLRDLKAIQARYESAKERA